MTTMMVIVMKYGMKWLEDCTSALLLNADNDDGLSPAACCPALTPPVTAHHKQTQRKATFVLNYC